ncbi:hypothetical protein V2J09_009132 [Rumex salicifolius]
MIKSASLLDAMMMHEGNELVVNLNMMLSKLHIGFLMLITRGTSLFTYTPQTSKGGGSSKRTKLNKCGMCSSSSNLESSIPDVEKQAMVRPLGVKSSKHKGKKVASKTTIKRERLILNQDLRTCGR